QTCALPIFQAYLRKSRCPGRNPQARVLREADPGTQAQGRRRGEAPVASQLARRHQEVAPVLSRVASPEAGTRERSRLFVFLAVASLAPAYGFNIPLKSATWRSTCP